MQIYLKQKYHSTGKYTCQHREEGRMYMKLSVEIHVLYKRYGDEKAIEMLKKAGYDSVDYSF